MKVPASLEFNNIINQYDIRVRYILKVGFFIIWPFGSFLFALFNFPKRENRLIIILFTAIFGYSMVAAYSGLDLYRVKESLNTAAQLNYKDLLNQFVTLYSRSNGELADVYRLLVTFSVSRFTNNSSWLMFVYGLIAGYVYSKVLTLFISEHIKINLYIYLLILSFSSIIGLDQLAGVRFPLAAYVFFYGAIRVILSQDNRFILIAALSVLIHFSFLSVVILLLSFYLFRLHRYSLIIYGILIISFILPQFLNSYIPYFTSIFGQAIENRVEGYTNIIYDIPLYSDTVWYVRYRINVIIIFCYLVLIISRIKKSELNYSSALNKLFYFALIILAFVNFTINIPHFGYRFQFVFMMIMLFYLFKLYSENTQSGLISKLALLSFPFSFLMIAYSLRGILYYTPITLYYFNLPGLFIDKSNIPAWIEIFG